MVMLRYNRAASSIGRGSSWSWLCSVDQPDVLPSLVVLAEEQPEGGYTLSSPLLPELISEYDTRDDLVPHLADALAVVSEIYEDRGDALPVDATHVLVYECRAGR